MPVGGLPPQGQMQALVAPTPARVAGLDALDGKAEPR